MKEILILNGPNLNLLGKREPEIYGHQSFDDFLAEVRSLYPKLIINYFQSNIEGELIDKLQDADHYCDGILLNAGGYTHTSVSLADAVAAIRTEVLEIHISQPAAREVERHTSLLSKYCKGSISGLGLQSYLLGIEYFTNKNK
ncbi:MAG: type II 3-dehydroquinate dehydratase [Vicingaceae bacterium]